VQTEVGQQRSIHSLIYAQWQDDQCRLREAARRFEEASGLRFEDKTLLQRALTHRSYINESREFLLADNERLEFLGDAVLDFLVGEYLYNSFPEMREGQLTNLRAALVRQETLAQFAGQLDLGNYLIMGRGEDDMGGRQRPAILCGAFEALIGALYLDQGFIAVKRFMMSLVDPILPELVRWIEKKDAKSRLQELCQAHLHTTPQYRTATTEGPDHARLFTMHVLIDGEVWGTGQGPSKRIASQEAAASAIIRLESLTT
jgi:ribonuclease-3